MTILRSFPTNSFHRFLLDESAATAIEYAMIAAGIGVAIAVTVTALGSSLTGKYQAVDSAYPR